MSLNTRLIDVVFNELDHEALDRLAALLAPRLDSRSSTTTTTPTAGSTRRAQPNCQRQRPDPHRMGGPDRTLPWRGSRWLVYGGNWIGEKAHLSYIATYRALHGLQIKGRILLIERGRCKDGHRRWRANRYQLVEHHHRLSER
jgi:hypothetical protein